MKVNRYLEDKTMDQIDHALGRPLDPMVESHRNYYAADPGTAAEMAASPFWAGGRLISGGLRGFCVTDAGRKALAEHLRKIGDPHRAYCIRFDGHERMVVGASRSKARYSYFLDLRDALPDLTFADYCRRISVSSNGAH